MTASYLVLGLTVLKISIKKSIFFLSDFLLYHTSISDIIDHCCIMENLKTIGKNQEQIKNNIP